MFQFSGVHGALFVHKGMVMLDILACWFHLREIVKLKHTMAFYTIVCFQLVWRAFEEEPRMGVMVRCTLNISCYIVCRVLPLNAVCEFRPKVY